MVHFINYNWFNEPNSFNGDGSLYINGLLYEVGTGAEVDSLYINGSLYEVDSLYNIGTGAEVGINQ